MNKGLTGLKARYDSVLGANADLRESYSDLKSEVNELLEQMKRDKRYNVDKID